jgi:hypothetical protein
MADRQIRSTTSSGFLPRVVELDENGDAVSKVPPDRPCR